MFFRNKHLVVLEPTENQDEKLDENIVYDVGSWTLPKELKKYVDEISEKKELNNEEKFLLVYEEICKETLIKNGKKIEKNIKEEFVLNCQDISQNH